MFRRFIPSPATVIASVALLVALSGSAVAAKVALAPKDSVGTAAIVNGSIRLVDIAPSTVKLLRGQKGDPGPQGAPGTVGPAGPAGAPGLAGGLNPAKIQVVTGGTVPVNPGSAATASVECPGGTYVIAGGGFTSGPGLFLSRVSGNGWVIGASAYTYVTASAYAVAVCVAP